MIKKKSTLIGLALIIASVLLQVAYAATSAVAGVARTRDFEVQIVSSVGSETSEYVTVNLESDPIKNGLIHVTVDNLYPGAYFTIVSKITNLGKEIRLLAVKVHQSGGNKELYDQLVFYDEQDNEITQDEYINYLTKQHKDKKLTVNEMIEFKLKMGLSTEVTELQNETAEFLLEIVYDQAEPGDGGGTDTDNPNSGGPSTPGTTITPSNEVEVTDETIPAGPASIEVTDEDIPGGSGDTEVVDEPVPGGPAKLPKTGGVGALFVYGLGLAMLGGGISIYRRGKKEDE